jgi:hypothetical protein
VLGRPVGEHGDEVGEGLVGVGDGEEDAGGGIDSGRQPDLRRADLGDVEGRHAGDAREVDLQRRHVVDVIAVVRLGRRARLPVPVRLPAGWTPSRPLPTCSRRRQLVLA